LKKPIAMSAQLTTAMRRRVAVPAGSVRVRPIGEAVPATLKR
jgi:hypothetical protein